MRPISLEMTAFGSYAEKAAVDFDCLGHGLYLIMGDTGAGKTTIFDALMFALYGAASGPDRTPEMMHCDFVDKSVDTRVALKFRQGNGQYTVVRSIHYPKRRGAANGFGDGMISASLEEPGKDILDGAAKVTARCAELIGLNADQFRKIVMLAQGEFKEFLYASGDKKNEILGRLFDSFAYVRYQELLRGARDALREERGGWNQRIEETMTAFFQPPEAGDENRQEQYLPGHPELLPALRSLVEDDRQRLREQEEERSRLRRQESALIQQRGAATQQNRLLDELAEKRRYLQSLQEQSDHMKHKQAECDAAERALHQVGPKKELAERANREWERACAEIEALERSLAGQEEALKAVQEAVDNDGPVRQEAEEINLEIQELKKLLPQYELLEKKQAAQMTACNEVREAEKKQAGAQRQRTELLAEQKRLEAEIAGLAGIDAQAVELKNRYVQAREKTAALTGEKGIQARVAKALLREKQLEEQRAELQRMTVLSAQAEERSHRLYQAFISGQAGLIAEDLRRELDACGKAVCPVCRSEFCAGQEHSFAPLAENTPTRDAVDAARRECEEQDRSREEQDRRVTVLKSEIKAEREHLLREAGSLLSGCEDWEMLTAEGWLTRQGECFRQAEAVCKSAWEAAARKRQHRDEMKERQAEVAGRLQEEEDYAARLGDALHGHQLSLKALEAEIVALQGQLKYPDKDAAMAQAEAQEQRRNCLEVRLNSHQKALDAAKKERDTTAGNLKGWRDSLPGLKESREYAEAALREALEQNGFASAEDACRALLPIEGGNGEDWLKERRRLLEQYRSDLKSTAERLAELEHRTGGISYTDLEALERQIALAADACQAADAAYNRLDKQLDNHHNAAERVAQATRALKKSEPLWNRLNRLADLAVGISGEGGKLSFDRYVMGTVFREILEMANRRLNTMSGGKYELIHQISTERKNGKAGLEVEVQDMVTGKQRNSRSLSGGESFLVSLSLALGLSDVVQAHAGGRKLEALFIDEGFGSLDSSTLDTALNVLNQLTEGECLVGIISHVSRLEESIPRKIRVKNSERGSRLQFEQ